MEIAIAQPNFRIGDFQGNAAKILAMAAEAQGRGSRLLLLPRRSLGGEPAGALHRHPEFFERSEEALGQLAEKAPAGLAIVLGLERIEEGRVRDEIAVLAGGKVAHRSSEEVFVFDFEGRKLGLLADSLEVETLERRLGALRSMGAELALIPGGQPFFVGGHRHRRDLLARLARAHGLPIAWAQPVGGNDSLIFEGGSLVVGPEGELGAAPRFEEATLCLKVSGPASPAGATELPSLPSVPLLPGTEDAEDIVEALCLGIRDYVRKSGFERVLLGLSGGIDSSLVTVLAARALGPEKVLAVIMPSKYTSTMSMEDAETLCSRLGVRMEVLPIDSAVEALSRSLEPFMGENPPGLVEENLQARARGALLMALSNKEGALVLNAGNKSELAVGYTTLYGDMVGALGVIGDLPKTWVYALARHLNLRHGYIPPRVLSRPPSAELRPGQKDEDSLPPYDRLDRILHLGVGEGWSIERMKEAHVDEETARRTLSLLLGSAYKRRQAVVPLRITLGGLHEEAYPMAHGFRF